MPYGTQSTYVPLSLSPYTYVRNNTEKEFPSSITLEDTFFSSSSTAR
jgi:hypothetical protein